MSIILIEILISKDLIEQNLGETIAIVQDDSINTNHENLIKLRNTGVEYNRPASNTSGCCI